MFKSILEKLPLNNFKQVLDLGCGQGEYAFMMANYLPEASITALDIENDRIRKINALIESQGIRNLKTHTGPIESLPDGISFEFIYSIDVFEHINEDEMPFGLAYERLNDGGFLLVKMPNKTQLEILPSKWFEEHNQWLEEEHIGQVYTLEDLVKRMKREGFKIVYASYGDGLISRLSWELAYLSRKGGAILQLFALPFLKLLIILDRLVHHNKKGNSIQVIGKK
jgi:cyclopropane fatty-acyl-phospholipid synthase-like methyltransferase